MLQNRNNTNKLIIFVLSLFLCVSLIKNYKDNKTAKELQNSFKHEIFITQNQLSEMLKKYDVAVSLYNNIDENIFAINNQKTTNNKQNTEFINPKNLNQINFQIEKIKDSIHSLELKLNSLEKLKINYNPNTKTVKIPKNTNNDLKRNTSKEFTVSNIQVKGVKFLSENTLNPRKKDIEQIRVCFTVLNNMNISKGNKELYIQIVNPKHQIMFGNDLSFTKNDKTLSYSKKINFYFNQQSIDLCNYVDLEKIKTIKGTYIINLYSGITKISSTKFNYN